MIVLQAAADRLNASVADSDRTRNMRLCVAQTRPIKGDIPGNIEHHRQLLDLAVSQRADVVIFPELSITGYEPTFARALATDPNDCRFDSFQQIAETAGVVIGVGAPIQNDQGISIAMVLFEPGQARQSYGKTYLHPDEEAYFASGQNSIGLVGGRAKIAMAICYEISIPDHAENAMRNGAATYIASVAKSASGVEKAVERLADIAKVYSMTVLMSNCVGPCDDFECGGKTSIWNNRGVLIGQMDDVSEGILLIDTETHELVKRTI